MTRKKVAAKQSIQMSRAARSSESQIKSGLKMEPHGVFNEVTKLCTEEDHYRDRWGKCFVKKRLIMSGLASAA